MHVLRSRNALCIVFALVLLAGCAQKPRIEFIPDGGSYTTDSAMEAGRKVEIGDISRLDAEDAAQARQDALASLRSREGSASAFAELMTKTFPADTRSVPVYAEAATVDGQPAWVVVEAWGGRSGRLDKRRVWILSSDGDVISSGTGE